ncbi:DNA-3-methyladenine glycosylase I [Sulfoacidibacillus ferrooxidans]|uniref:Uncharacterized protein n=1 Tax=Sulfoacidibacillus ferrooxidans TaxID=2005001 RepID=A0A9X2AE38_9BACL|nr:DNA-3-methyladenine glycosylase I [Sulfoacidibacillus ferrooxidans]MCI0182756.1 hypothetical protein [Sulfoacidibacillus ferrooxidans]
MQTATTWRGSDEVFFELLTKLIFCAGFSKTVVNHRWSAFRQAFCAFQIGEVMTFDEVVIESLLSRESGIIRNARKVQATVVNARICSELVLQYGSLQQFVDAVCSLEAAAGQTMLRKTFALVGESTARSIWRELQGDLLL